MTQYGLPKLARVVKNQAANTGGVRDAGLIPPLGRSPGEGNGNPLQYSCLENHSDRGAWRVTVHRVTKSQIGLKQLSTQAMKQYMLSKKTDNGKPNKLSQVGT